MSYEKALRCLDQIWNQARERAEAERCSFPWEVAGTAGQLAIRRGLPDRLATELALSDCQSCLDKCTVDPARLSELRIQARWELRNQRSN